MVTYTDDQKNRIMQMPSAVLLSAMVADKGSAVVGMREFMAGEKFISEASTMYPNNSLVQAMARNSNFPNLEQAAKPIFSSKDTNAIRQESQKKIQDGLATLANDNEAREYKAFLVALAEKVTNAAGEGFFGNKGAKVSPDEAAYINRLKQQMGTDTSPSM